MRRVICALVVLMAPASAFAGDFDVLRGAQPVGYALFFNFYSSWRGSGIFLEDLFVREPFRGRGIGRTLLAAIARIARQEGSYAIRWEVLDWNQSAIQFYKSLGAEFVDEWKQVLLPADALDRLANTSPSR